MVKHSKRKANMQMLGFPEWITLLALCDKVLVAGGLQGWLL